jgi:hypothetical protein
MKNVFRVQEMPTTTVTVDIGALSVPLAIVLTCMGGKAGMK